MIDISMCKGLEEIFKHNYKLILPKWTLYVNLYRNEITEENLLVLLKRTLSGSYVNTVGNMNLNKIIKHF